MTDEEEEGRKQKGTEQEKLQRFMKQAAQLKELEAEEFSIQKQDTIG